MPKAIRKLPPAEYLHQCFEHDAASGTLRYRQRPQDHFRSPRECERWNERFAGVIAGRPTPKGYLQCALDATQYYVARIVYKMHYGSDPEWMDHRDRDRSNNRVDNLRSASMRENNRNMVKRIGQAGYVGVRLLRDKWRNKRFCAVIRDDAGKKVILGHFHTAEEAHAAYRAAAERVFGEFSPL